MQQQQAGQLLAASSGDRVPPFGTVYSHAEQTTKNGDFNSSWVSATAVLAVDGYPEHSVSN